MSQKHRVNNAFQQSMTTILLAAVLIFTAITFLSIVQLGDNGFGSIHDFVDNSHVKHQDEKPDNFGVVADKGYVIVDENKGQTGNIPPLTPVMQKAIVKEVPQVDERVSEGPKSCAYYKEKDSVSNLFYWKSGPSEADLAYRSPFADTGPANKYVTFEPDMGGWNNIRMQMELVLVFSYATGRTLVLPPTQQMYLLSASHTRGESWKNIVHGFGDFFPFNEISRRRFPVISMAEYMEREGITGHFINQKTKQVQYPPQNRTVFKGTDKFDRRLMWSYLQSVSACPKWHGFKDFVIIPPGPGINISDQPDVNASTEFAASGRKRNYYDEYWQKQPHIHFISNETQNLRLLEHFYTFIHFEDQAMDKYYKRFIRDEVHYIDLIFCKAAIIVDALLKEASGGFSAFHIRRGEFQYKNVKVSAEKLLKNVGHLLPAEQPLVFLASDERNKSWFQPFHDRFPGKIRSLDDYMDLAQLRDINPNYLGMIDQVLCSAANGVFVGTWFSTFSGYITRMRGYLGYKDKSVYYGDKEHRDRFQTEELPHFPFYMREFNQSWDRIDP